jgi:uncharacterized membrane protein
MEIFWTRMNVSMSTSSFYVQIFTKQKKNIFKIALAEEWALDIFIIYLFLCLKNIFFVSGAFISQVNK